MKQNIIKNFCSLIIILLFICFYKFILYPKKSLTSLLTGITYNEVIFKYGKPRQIDLKLQLKDNSEDKSFIKIEYSERKRDKIIFYYLTFDSNYKLKSIVVQNYNF